MHATHLFNCLIIDLNNGIMLLLTDWKIMLLSPSLVFHSIFQIFISIELLYIYILNFEMYVNVLVTSKDKNIF